MVKHLSFKMVTDSTSIFLPVKHHHHHRVSLGCRMIRNSSQFSTNCGEKGYQALRTGILKRLVQPVADCRDLNWSPEQSEKLGNRWMEYQGIGNWDGLLYPLDDILRREILRYGNFVCAAYMGFGFDPSSPTYGTCLFPKNSLIDRTGLAPTGYRMTKNLRATSGMRLPWWLEMAPDSSIGMKSSWIGYVAVCREKDEIARLGRRDVVIAFRGTSTCMEWLENFRATLTHLPNHHNVNGSGCGSGTGSESGPGPMVENGFLSLYTSGPESLQEMVRSEVSRILEAYRDEPLSLTFTGHSLGAALATVAAYDIKTWLKKKAPMVTVMSFGGPRVGNSSFRRLLETQGTKVLRIVNSDDLITKVPGFVTDDNNSCKKEASKCGINHMRLLFTSWIQRRVEKMQLLYSEVGTELRLSSSEFPEFEGSDVAACHDLKTYLHLVIRSLSCVGRKFERFRDKIET